MGGKFELGRVTGIPVLIDVSFLLIVLLYGQRYFLSGNTQQMSAGIVIVIGLAASVLVHELAHAYTGRFFGVGVSHIELNGLGGLCYWHTAMRGEPIPRIAISIAGPISNLVLYYVLRELATLPAVVDKPMLRGVLGTLASTNLLLCIFNMLPAFPLDGGKALEAVLGPLLGVNATRLVAMIGLLVAAWLVTRGLYEGAFTLMLAALIGIANWQMLQSYSGPNGRR